MMKDKSDAKFKAWMRQVDRAIETRCGLTHQDLADQCFRDWFEAGISPVMAALHTLRDEGFEG